MLIHTLTLERYGAFTDQTVRFGPGLTVVLGLNEAGKSTALHAMSDLLWGIPRKSAHAFLHGRQALTLRAELTLDDGGGQQPKTLIRRSSGLIDVDTGAEQAPTWRDDSDTAERWLQSFGLSHHQLRAGGAALCRGEGDLAQLVFTARSGQEVRGLLDELNRAADSLYKGHRGAKNVQARVAFDAYQRAAGAASAATAAVRDVDAAAERLTEAETAVTRTQAQVDQARAAHAECERRCRAAPYTRRLAEIQTRITAIRTAGIVLTPAQLQEWDEATQAYQQAQDRLARLEEDLAGLRQARSGVVVDDALLADAGEVGRLQRECEARLRDRDRAAQALEDAARDEQAARELLTGLVGIADQRPVADLIAQLDVPDDLAAQLAALATQLTRADEQVHDRQQALAEAEQAFEHAADVEAPDPSAVAVVQEVVDALEAAGSATQRQREAIQAAAEAQLRRDQALLLAGLPTGASVPTSLPAVKTISEVSRQLATAKIEVETAAQAVVDAAETVAARTRELAASADPGAPGPGELRAARAQRDHALGELTTAWLTGQPIKQAADLPGVVTRLTAHADWVADQAIQHAESVARSEQLAAALADAQTAHNIAHTRRQQATDRLADAEQTWRALWPELATAGTIPDPGDAVEVRAQLVAAQAAHAELTVAHQQQEALAAQVAAQTQTLATALEQAGRGRPGADLDSLLQAARHLLAEADAAREARAAAAQLGRQRDDARRALAAAQEGVAQLTVRWRDLLATQGLPLSLDPVGWQQRHELVRQASGQVRAAQSARAQAARDDDAWVVFAAAVRELADRHGLDGREPVDTLVQTLVDRVLAASEARRQAADLDQRIQALGGEHVDASTARDQAQRRLSALQEATGVVDLAELEGAARRGRELAGLTAEADEQARLIQAVAPHVDRPDHPWVAALADSDDAVLDADLRAAQAELDQAEQALREALDDRGRLQERMRGLSTRQGAAELHAQAQEQLAQLAERVERYLVTDIQRQVLASQLEAYERRHASPLLDHAGVLLEQLTGGRYVAMRAVDSGERRELVVVGADEQARTPDQLSEGTADQVFLALRLAGIAALQADRQARGRSPLPVVLDDVLMAFDDERTIAALQVMARLATGWQIVVFSHHAHVGELAERLDADITVSRLEGRAEVQTARPAAEVRERARY